VKNEKEGLLGWEFCEINMINRINMINMINMMDEMDSDKKVGLEHRLDVVCRALEQKDLVASELVHYRTKESLLQDEYRGITGAYYNSKATRKEVKE